MLLQLRPAGALAAVEGGQLVAAPALLAEALLGAVAHERGQLDVHLADAAALVVCRQSTQLPAAALHLIDDEAALASATQRIRAHVPMMIQAYETVNHAPTAD